MWKISWKDSYRKERSVEILPRTFAFENSRIRYGTGTGTRGAALSRHPK
jgi:hypothetical protein